MALTFADYLKFNEQAVKYRSLKYAIVILS